MSDKILIGDIIYKLRRERGMSQTELAEKVGVTNKAVSKWETYEANPDLNNLTKLAEVFNVSCDELLSMQNDKKVNREDDKSASEQCQDSQGGSNTNLFGMIKGISKKTNKSYEFISDKKTKKGTPYAHINLGLNQDGSIRKAEGIIAVGIVAKGILSLGIVSVGLISIGIVAIGLIAIGAISLGALIAVGSIAIGFGVSVGAVAVGVIAVGAVSIGVVSVGAVSIGVWAHTGVFGKAIGMYISIH